MVNGRLVRRYPITFAAGVLALLAVAVAVWLWPRSENVYERELAGIGEPRDAVRDERIEATGERMLQNLRALERASTVFGQQADVIAGVTEGFAARLDRVTALVERIRTRPDAVDDETFAALESEVARLRGEAASLDSAVERIRDLESFLATNDFGAAYDELVTSTAEPARRSPAWLSFPVVLAFVVAAALLTFGVAYVADRKIWQTHRSPLTPEPTGRAEDGRSTDDDRGG